MKKNIKRTQLLGFTLIEVMMVVVIIGILAATAIPALSKYMKKSKTSEAKQNIRKIYDGEIVYFMEENMNASSGSLISKYFVNAAANPSSIPGVNKVSANWELSAWHVLKFSSDSPVLYQYEAVSSGVGTTASFTARARGDTDGDGITSIFERVGTVTGNGEEIGGAGVYSNKEFE